MTSDAKFETSDIKASVAAIAFILSSAAKHSVDGNSLDNEMQQLGLPKGKQVTLNHHPLLKTHTHTHSTNQLTQTYFLVYNLKD